MINNGNSSNQFARFVSTSPLSSIPHDPAITLASNCIRDFFGPTVQLVADGLMSRMMSGGCTLPQIISIIETKAYASAEQSEERRKIMRQNKMRSSTINFKGNGDRPSHASVRASLLALIQHSVVTVKTRSVTSRHRKNQNSTNRSRIIHLYQIDIRRARLFPRYPRLVAFIKKLQDETAATLVEEILVQGRLRTVQAIVLTVEQIQQQQQDDESTQHHRYTSRQAVVESFLRLWRGGFLEQVPSISETQNDNVDEEGEMEFDGKTMKIEIVDTDDENDKQLEGEDPSVVSLLRTGAYKNLPPTAIWRVNMDMIHEQLRAVSLGWLVAERYNHKIQSSGSIITAALKLAASHKHGNASLKNNGSNDYENVHNFTVENILRYLPKTVVQSFEKREGGVVPNIYKALVELARVSNPAVVEEVEVAPGQPAQCKFTVQTNRLVQFLRDRIVHQIILDTHGEVAARICPILRLNGYMESDQVAESAMVPAKDTRELLHRLYRDHYIELFNINQGKQHNPSSMIYLWGYSRPRGTRTAAENVCKALVNMRLRRQHEVEVGKDWIERAKEAGATDENENEVDKLMFSRFCQGLERLDNAAIQLDETLMVLKDY